MQVASDVRFHLQFLSGRDALVKRLRCSLIFLRTECLCFALLPSVGWIQPPDEAVPVHPDDLVHK